jgi:periplasmic mercuric ion binding protein
MIRTLLLTVFLALTSVQVMADHHQSSEKVVFVKGMVCAFCAQGIERRFTKEPEIEAIKVELEQHRVTLNFKAGKMMDDERIASILKAAGYTVDDTRTN